MKADLYDKTLNDICNKERSLGFSDDTIWGIPIWRLVHVQYRNYFMSVIAGIPAMSNHPQFRLGKIITASWKSLIKLITICLRCKHVSNLFFGFPRLEKFNDKYIDKFIDPLIVQSNIGNDYLYLERGRSGEHKSPRYIADNILWTEFIDCTVYVLSVLFAPLWWMCHIQKYTSIINKLSHIVNLNFKQKVQFVLITTRRYCKVAFLYILFRNLKAKRLFMPVALIHCTYLFAAKKAGIKVYEIQHGITVNNTTTYSGEYNKNWYPDLFLAFGMSSMKDYLFGVPESKMLNIGCAFKSLLTNSNRQCLSKTYLFLSDPEITDVMVVTFVDLANRYPHYQFHYRPHPHEKLNDDQKAIIDRTSNTKIVECLENSTVTCMNYEGVIAENTTVLYEAISVGVKAARLQYNGLTTIHFSDEIEGLFYYMQKPDDFEYFAETFVLNDFNKEFYYSSFNSKQFNALLK